VIGSGSNFGATANILVEIVYSVNEVQFFYTRNFIHHYFSGKFPQAQLQLGLNQFKSGKQDAFGFGDMLPETAVILRRDKHTIHDKGEERTIFSYHLRISADIGAGVCMASPGNRMIEIQVDLDEAEGIEFMQQLLDEIVDLHRGKHPDPARIPAGSSAWGFARQVNQQAYDRIASNYEEGYFSQPLLTETFDAWLDDVPAGGHILDLGCGHGVPVIARLLEKGYRVTGADLSAKMLERARETFPDVAFINGLGSELTFEDEFDGVCSLSSLLYLDPIDLSHSLYRLHHALKPKGLLFLYAYDQHPGYRGNPYHLDLGQWIWGWTYGMDEAVRVLEEHETFKVLTVEDVTPEQEQQERLAIWYNQAKEQYDSQQEAYPNSSFPPPDRSKPPVLPYKYVVVAQAR
jgi:SAM-dependent methyltransferase